MSSADKLISIPSEDWIELRDLFKIDWPRHELAHNTIQNYLNWVQIDPRIKHLEIFSINGSWRENGTYLIVDRYHVFASTLDESCESLKRAFLLLDWDYSYLICCLRKCHRPCLEEVLSTLRIEIQAQEQFVIYRRAKEDTINFQIDLPPALHLKQLKTEHAEYANRSWPHRHEGSEYFLKRLVSWNPSVGLFNESNELLAWSFVWPTGCIGPLEVHPDHRKKGYGTIIAKAIAKEVAQVGLSCYGSIVSSNVVSIGMFSKLGFTATDELCAVRNRARKLCEWQE